MLPLVQALFCLALIPLVLREHYKSFLHRLFAFFLLCLVAWGIIVFGMRSSPNTAYAFRWDKWLIPLAELMVVVFFHFSVRYTTMQVKNWLFPVLYMIPLIFIPLTGANLVFTGMQVKSYGYAPVFGPLNPVHMLFTYGLMVTALVNFVRGYRAAIYAEQRRRFFYIMVGISIFLLGGTFDVLPILGLPLYPGMIFGNILFGLFTSVAILKDNILEIRVMVRRGTAHLVTSMLVAIPFVAVFLSVTIFHTVELLPSWVYIVVVVVLALILPQLWRVVQHVVDRWFYRDRYNYLAALADFSRDTQSITDSASLGPTVVNLMAGALKASGAYLLLAQPLDDDFTVAASAGGGNMPPTIVLGGRSPLAKWLRIAGDMVFYRELEFIPVLQGVIYRESADMGRAGVELIIPLKTSEGYLVGVLMLGQKLSSEPYTVEETSLINTLRHQIAVKMENARLYYDVLETREGLEARNQQLQVQSKQLMAQQQELLKKTDELETANRAKSEFLAVMSHELRTPLNSVIGFSELMLDGVTGEINQEQRQCLDDILSGGMHLLSLISDVLDLSKVEAGKMTLEPESLDLAEVVDDALQTVKPLLDKYELECRVNIAAGLPRVRADRSRLRQILLNLLSNAIKFTPGAGKVAIEAVRDDGCCRVTVTDTGIGIKPEDRERIFDAFIQGETLPDRVTQGTGLGLALTRHLVESGGGRIWVESQYGQGSKFIFTLLLAEDGPSSEGGG
ncbi:MAG: ATP-binding protein [Chloroflexota bacterium]